MNTVYCFILSSLLAAGCAAVGGQPRITEVDRKTYVKQYRADEQHEDFYVVWTGANISLVKFEYRQVNAPGELFAKSYVPTTRRRHVFVISADEFQRGGKVSAWRATLWQDNKIVAEQKSALW
jgi:hypothetical protein